MGYFNNGSTGVVQKASMVPKLTEDQSTQGGEGEPWVEGLKGSTERHTNESSGLKSTSTQRYMGFLLLSCKAGMAAVQWCFVYG